VTAAATENGTAGLAAHLAGWEPEPLSRTEVLALEPVHALAAVLDEPSPVRAPGDPLPALWHWLHFLDQPRQEELGEDGHPRHGHFLPPVPDRRRMFAGGRYRQEEPLRVGEPYTRTSRLGKVEVKQGRSGEMAFVTVRHELSRDGRTVAVDEQDLVYRQQVAGARGAPGAGSSAGSAPEPAELAVADGELVVAPDPVMLFRFSALTANAHRIHYDVPYATGVEGFPGLVVHGPLLVLLLLEQPRRHTPDRPVTELSYRLQRPVFVGRPVHVQAERTGSSLGLSAGVGDGDCASATAVLAP
jgi:3-methylfumaryl-CoA hydratase